MDTLLQQLRACDPLVRWTGPDGLMGQAANRIETLEADAQELARRACCKKLGLGGRPCQRCIVCRYAKAVETKET